MTRYSHMKNSTKIFLAATILAAIIFGISQFFFCCEESGEVVAKVNGTKIYQSQIEHKLSMLLGGARGQNIALPAVETLQPEVLQILAKEVYFDNQLTKIAKKSAATKTEKVKSLIRETKGEILRQAYIKSLIEEATTEDKLTEKYSEFASELKDKKEYSLAHILVKDEAEANRIAKNTQRGTWSFASAAKKYSLDKESAKNGGNLGFLLETNLIKEIAEQVTKMKKGEVSSPIKTNAGFHIIKVVDIRDAETVPFEEAKDALRQEIIKEILDEKKEEILKDIKIEVLTEKPEAKSETKAEVEEVEIEVDAEKEDQSEPKDEPKASN